MLTELATPKSLEVQLSVAQQAFATLADMPVFPAPESTGLAGAAESVFVANLQYLGECSGSVRLECSHAIAYAFTHRVIEGSQPTSLDADVRDAVGELVNTIGGNLKGLLPAGVRLSTPTVAAGLPLNPTAAGCLSCLPLTSQFGDCRLLLLPTERAVA